MDAALWMLYRCSLTYDFLFCLNCTLHEWWRPSHHGPESQDRDWDLRVPRPRRRLRCLRPRPIPRLVKTGLEMSRDQVSSLKNSKSGNTWHYFCHEAESIFVWTAMSASEDKLFAIHYRSGYIIVIIIIVTSVKKVV